MAILSALMSCSCLGYISNPTQVVGHTWSPVCSQPPLCPSCGTPLQLQQSSLFPSVPRTRDIDIECPYT